MLDKCPTCGSEVRCETTPGTVWCVSPECGAVFRDVDTRGRGGVGEDDSAGDGITSARRPSDEPRS